MIGSSTHWKILMGAFDLLSSCKIDPKNFGELVI